MKIRDTVANLTRRPDLRARYNDILLACAYELSDSISRRLIEAHRRMGEVDPDNELAWHNGADEISEAESVFLDIHGNTEVTL